MSDDAFERADEYVQREMRDRCIPGLAVAVTDRRNPLWVATYGLADIGARNPVTPLHKFQIGSISKSFTSIALLQLQEEGRLSIDDHVTKHLPWFKVRTEYGPITIKHLMSHTAGIVMGTDSSPSAYAEVSALGDLETGSAPGTYFHYSNSGYKVLGLVLEEVTGKENSQVLMERVIGPLGMDSTEAEITSENRSSQPVGYTFFQDDRPPPSCPRLAPASWFESNTADGSIISTPADMTAYLRMLLNRGEGEETRIMSRRSYGLLTSRAIRPGDAQRGEYYGLGLSVGKDGGHNMVGHTGGMVGFVSEIMADLDSGLGVVVLNNSRVDISGIARQILRTVRAVRNGTRLPLTRRYDPTAVRGARAYAGSYVSRNNRIRIEANGNRLMLRTKADAVTLETRGKDRFYAPHPGFELYEVRFGRKAGRVVEMFSGPDWYVRRPYSGPRSLRHPKEWDAYIGQYRAHNPWLPSFRIVERKGSLVYIDPLGNEEPLTLLGDGSFRMGPDPQSPERIRFDRWVRGRTTRAVLSGGEWCRVASA